MALEVAARWSCGLPGLGESGGDAGGSGSLGGMLRVPLRALGESSKGV